MAWCLDIGTGAAANGVGSLFKKVVEEVKLIIYLPQAISDMEGEVQRLGDLMNEINVELARVNMNPKSIVKGWLDRAGEAIESSGSIGSDYEQHKTCLTWCPNCVCRYRIGRRIRDWKASVAELHLQRQSDFHPTGEYGDPTPRTQVLVQNPESGSGIVVDTRRSTQMELVERWLTDKDSSIRRIGIQGMGGVGKSSLLDAINDSQRVRDSFELIIKVIVSRNHILGIQNSVADRLKLGGFQENSNFEERKEMLRSFLKNKKYLILLDDMWLEDLWTSVELQDLGVSLNDTAFKILLTTRDKQVCARMQVQEIITVEPLLEEEGWQLFRSRAFENGNVPHEIEQVARDIAKECKGLPLALIVVAAAMAHHTELYEWENALTDMKNVDETFYDLHAGVDQRLFQRLQWSYDVLKPDNLKICFLYFAAYPEDEVISSEKIIDLWIAEGLVKGSGDSYLQDKGHEYIKQLGDRCLIEMVSNDYMGRIERFKIHDVLRDLAIRIAEKEQRCHFKAGVGVSHFPSEEDLKGCARMSLMRNALHSLPTTFACSSLTVLLLSQNPGITEVPESFLSQLPSLRVLDLSNTGITSLPPSIGNLKYLACLNLSGCEDICELPESIGDLKELQFLNLWGCLQLRCLPESISELKLLRALHITYCQSLEHLPRGVSELVSIERLVMCRSALKLSFEEKANAERKYACLKDLQSLSGLRVFSADIKSPVKEGVLGNWSKMRDLSLGFEEAVGQDYLPRDMQAMKDLEALSLRYCNLERLPSWVIQFRKLAYLVLGQCGPLKELPSELPCLRKLGIYECLELEELQLGIGFPKLQEVSLNSLQSLKSVGVGLPCLRKLGIYECLELEELQLGIGFPKPQEVSLSSLHSLRSVGVGAVDAASGSGGLGGLASPLPTILKSLHVNGCEHLRLRGEWDKLNHLERIECSRRLWDAIQCDDPNIKASLESKYRKWG